MIEILKYCLEGGFWHFVGCWFVLYICGNLIVEILKELLK